MKLDANRVLSALIAAIGFVSFGAAPASAEAAKKRPRKQAQSVVDGDPALSEAAIAASGDEYTTYGPDGTYRGSSQPTLAVAPLAPDAPLAREQAPAGPGATTAPMIGASEPESATAAMPPGLTPEAVSTDDSVGEVKPSDTDTVNDEPFKHGGFVAEIQGGAMGCTRSICAGQDGHNAGAGGRVDGFLGGNIGGFLEIGLAGGYGSMRPKVVEGTNALELYGLEAPDIPPELLDGFDLNTLNVTGARLDDLRAGPSLRVHFVRKGRVQAFAGTGFGYHRFRGRYDTPSGKATLAFHGIDIPIQAGLGVYLTKRLSMGIRFDYIWTYFAAVSVKHPQANMVAPLGFLDQQLESRNQSLMGNLPQFWTTALGLRLTL